MLNKNLIKKKLELIITYLDELKPIASLKYHDFINNYLNLRTAERDLQLIIDAAVEINSHIIVEQEKNPPKDYFDSFIKLGELKILPENFAKKLAPSAGLRNRLVHEYDTIDLAKLYEALNFNLDDYKKYCRCIDQYLKKI